MLQHVAIGRSMATFNPDEALIVVVEMSPPPGSSPASSQ